jgi:hypothetical protein
LEERRGSPIFASPPASSFTRHPSTHGLAQLSREGKLEPDFALYKVSVGLPAFGQRRFDEALEYAKKATDFDWRQRLTLAKERPQPQYGSWMTLAEIQCRARRAHGGIGPDWGFSQTKPGVWDSPRTPAAPGRWRESASLERVTFTTLSEELHRRRMRLSPCGGYSWQSATHTPHGSRSGAAERNESAS